MRFALSLLILPSLLLFAVPVSAQTATETDSEYLQNRAKSLNDRIDVTERSGSLSKRRAANLHVSVGRVQTDVGKLQNRDGMIDRQAMDRMNQQLTDVERTLTHQP